MPSPTFYVEQTTQGSTSWNSVSCTSDGVDGLYVDIDYSHLGLTVVPHIVANVVGHVDDWVMLCTVSNITTTDARVYIKSIDPRFNPTALDANSKDWAVSCIIFDRELKTFPRTFVTCPCVSI